MNAKSEDLLDGGGLGGRVPNPPKLITTFDVCTRGFGNLEDNSVDRSKDLDHGLVRFDFQQPLTRANHVPFGDKPLADGSRGVLVSEVKQDDGRNAHGAQCSDRDPPWHPKSISIGDDAPGVWRELVEW